MTKSTVDSGWERGRSFEPDVDGSSASIGAEAAASPPGPAPEPRPAQDQAYLPELTSGVESAGVESSNPPGAHSAAGDVARALAALDGRVEEALRIARAKDEVVDRLHAENQRLRAGEIALAQMPLLRDLMGMHDDMERILDGESVTARDLEFTREVLIDVLSRNGIRRFVPALGDAFDSAAHTAVEVRVTPDAGEDRTIAAVSRAGFRREDGSVLRAAEVTVSRWREPAPDVPVDTDEDIQGEVASAPASKRNTLNEEITDTDD